MQNHEYKKVAFVTFGGAVSADGWVNVLADLSKDPVIWTTVILHFFVFIVGVIFVFRGFVLKSKHQIILDFLKDAQKYSERMQDLKILWKSHGLGLEEGSRIRMEDFENFRAEVVNAIGEAYKEEHALKFRREIFRLAQHSDLRTLLNGKNVNKQIDIIKNEFKTFAGYLFSFPIIKDFGAYLNPDFDPEDLKRYSNFKKQNYELTKKIWIGKFKRRFVSMLKFLKADG